MTTKEKYELIDKTKINEKILTILRNMEQSSSNFTDEAVNSKIDGALEKLIEQIRANKPEALRTLPEAKKEVKKEKEKAIKKNEGKDFSDKKDTDDKTGLPKKDTLEERKDIIKEESETEKEARDRAKKELEKEKEKAKDEVESQIEKLNRLILEDPALRGFNTGTAATGGGRSTPIIDAERKALPRGSRVSQKGWKNQYGASDGGRKYWENRENRSDRKSPEYETGKPYLAKGGNVYSSDELYIVKVYDGKTNELVDMSKRVWARNLQKAKEEAIYNYEDDMKQQYGDDLRFQVEEAPSMFADGGETDGELYIAYENTFKRFDSDVPVPMEDFEKLLHAYQKQLSGDKLDVVKYEVLKGQMGNYLGHKTVEEMEAYFIQRGNSYKMANGGEIKNLIGKEFRPFTATSNNEYNVKIVQIDFDNVTYKHKDGQVKKSKTSDFLDSYIQIKNEDGYMANGGELNGNLYRVGYLKVYENDEEGDTVYTKEIYGDSEEDVSSKFKKIHPKYKIQFISKYADGGMMADGGEVEGVDLFEDYDDQPEEVQAILANYEMEDNDYETLQNLKAELESIGYTMDFGLDAEPYDLRKIGEKGKSEFYAKGGMMADGGKLEEEISKIKSLGGDWQSYDKGVMAGKKDDGYVTIENEADLNDYIYDKTGYIVKNIEVIEKGKNYPYNRSNPYFYDTYLVTLKNGSNFTFERSYGRPNWQGNVNYIERIKITNINTKHAKGDFMADGGMMAKGGSVNDDLENFDIFKLDDFEYMQYNHFIEKSKVSKKEALEILINNVEGDYSQLSPKLRAIAKRHKMAEGGMMADGGETDDDDTEDERLSMGESVYFEVFNDDGKDGIIVFRNDGSKIIEALISGDIRRFTPQRYMSYLTKKDLQRYLNRDFNYVEEVDEEYVQNILLQEEKNKPSDIMVVKYPYPELANTPDTLTIIKDGERVFDYEPITEDFSVVSRGLTYPDQIELRDFLEDSKSVSPTQYTPELINIIEVIQANEDINEIVNELKSKGLIKNYIDLEKGGMMADGGYVNQYFGKGYEDDAITELKKALPNHKFEKGKNKIIVDGGKYIIYTDEGRNGIIRIYDNGEFSGGIGVERLSEAIEVIKKENLYDIGGIMANGGRVNTIELEREIKETENKYPKAKVSYSFAKDSTGKGYVIRAKEGSKIVYSSYKAKYGGMMADGGEIKNLIGKEFRPFTATSNNEYNVKIVKIDFDNVTYKHKDGQVKKSKTSDFLDSYIQVKNEDGYMADGGETGVGREYVIFNTDDKNKAQNYLNAKKYRTNYSDDLDDRFDFKIIEVPYDDFINYRIIATKKMAEGGEVDFNERMAKMRNAYENLNMIVKSRIAVAVGIDRAISIMERDYSIDPFGLITSAVRGGLLELDEINKDLVNEAVYEAERVTDDYRDSGQGIGGSDMTYFTKSVLDGVGYKTGFVNNRLTRVDADGNELVIDKYEMNY